jgi:hypothetical protein
MIGASTVNTSKIPLRSQVSHRTDLSLPPAVPHAATARRPEWTELPGPLRRWVQDQLGAPVVAARSQGSGYTPGFASRLQLADGRRRFVKIADSSRDWLITSYADEATKRRLLPRGVAAPALIDSSSIVIDDRSWLMLIFDDIDGGPPRRPWTMPQVRAAVEAIEASARALDPAPSGYPWQPLSVELGGLSPDKEAAIDRHFPEHAGELRELVEGFADRCVGSALVHADLRDDNMIIDSAGRGWICDWNFPVLGRSYVDLVTLLISVRGDGLDADAVLAASPLVSRSDRDGIDSLLADLTLYYLISGRAAEPDGSPHLRAHQRWSGAVTAAWLAERRGW